MDYAGDTVPVIVDWLSGETRPAQIFVAVMDASSFTYAKAAWTQGLCDWLSAHVGALEAIGGAPTLLVPRQCQGGGDQGLRLRSCGQPQLC